MKNPITVPKLAWLLAIGCLLAFALSACKSTGEPPKGEHPEHPQKEHPATNAPPRHP